MLLSYCMQKISFLEKNYIRTVKSGTVSCVPFFYKNEPLKVGESPFCFLTFAACGNMKWTYQGPNQNRIKFFQDMPSSFSKKTFIDMQLGHTKTVLQVDSLKDLPQNTKTIADGLFTNQKDFVPVVTVADCVPIYFFDTKTKYFGIVHSGWKGTGIIKTAIQSICKTKRACVQDFCVVIGPCIHAECYTVSKQRAKLFQKDYVKGCIVAQPRKDVFSIDLPKANLKLLKDIGVKDYNIAIAQECTRCTPAFASYRRQKQQAPDAIPIIMAAFVSWL